MDCAWIQHQCANEETGTIHRRYCAVYAEMKARLSLSLNEQTRVIQGQRRCRGTGISSFLEDTSVAMAPVLQQISTASCSEKSGVRGSLLKQTLTRRAAEKQNKSQPSQRGLCLCYCGIGGRSKDLHHKQKLLACSVPVPMPSLWTVHGFLYLRMSTTCGLNSRPDRCLALTINRHEYRPVGKVKGENATPFAQIYYAIVFNNHN